ncbi:TPA: hypothetical protein HA219_02130 [Candidatus Woesearchaeota archaeon]|nr:hypothetical protein [Candidatus Woesearchaeota archaeon]HIH39498.1 hypothetical protein [Candidatus Woesearchaeota archaeon]
MRYRRIQGSAETEQNKEFVKLFGVRYRFPSFFLGYKRSNSMTLEDVARILHKSGYANSEREAKSDAEGVIKRSYITKYVSGNGGTYYFVADDKNKGKFMLVEDDFSFCGGLIKPSSRSI